MKLNKNNIYYGGVRRKLRETNKTSVDSFNEFINIVGINSKLTNATLLIGINYNYPNNLNREIDVLQPDFCWSENSTNSSKDQWYQLLFPFSINIIRLTDDFFYPLVAIDFVEDSNKIDQVFPYFQNNPILNKFSLIVFDSSTSKFLFPNIMKFITHPSFISYLYYYFLQTNGELYIDLYFSSSSLSIFEASEENLTKLKRIIENRKLVNDMKENDEIFGQKFIYIYYNKLIQVKGKIVEKHIFNNNINKIEYTIPEPNKDIIQQNNIEYLRRNLINSGIEYFPNEDGESSIREEEKNRTIYLQTYYPIKKTNFPIGPFIKITKTSDLRFSQNNISSFRKVFDSIYNDLLIHKRNPRTFPKDLQNLNCIFI
jgi:hypothetical protein